MFKFSTFKILIDLFWVELEALSQHTFQKLKIEIFWKSVKCILIDSYH